MKYLGIDIGSTTIKYVLLDEQYQIVEKSYQRHLSKIKEQLIHIVKQINERYPKEELSVTLSGSAGMGFAEKLDLPFVQEVYAERLAVNRNYPETDAVIELGGEDAKILFLTDGFEMRMNGTCAGGTGAFIDQMATLLQTTPDGLNELAERYEAVYPIASRCGVFAKSDIQPLINQGARHEDIAASIFYAVVSQTISGLAQGRQIKGNILYLGGPLFFLPELRHSFDDALHIKGTCPENALYYVAYGAGISKTGRVISARDLLHLVSHTDTRSDYNSTSPLFVSEMEYEAFKYRHRVASEGIAELPKPNHRMYLGIDAGSTTIKAILCDDEGNVFKPLYAANHGDPVEMIREYLLSVYHDYPGIQICGSAVTGYGEQLIQEAFGIDHGIVETVAHYTAAKKFKPDVDFILDIGGQDIKCFQIRNGLIESLYLNEACSSGCGSFLQAFSATLGMTVEEFSRKGLFAEAPVDLGSRCTVFMNSSVKQAQKDGASIENIAAGLSISIVKNALYKVIRCADPSKLGKNIVVQGGTFINDCVLRAFENEIGNTVTRPALSGLMGAYGAALYASTHTSNALRHVLSPIELQNFVHSSKNITCSGCRNACKLTVNSFSNGGRFIAGNRCSKPIRAKESKAVYNLYRFKQDLLRKYRKNEINEEKLTVGFPMGLNFFDLLPFWYTFFSELGFNIIVSPDSDRELYVKGQNTIASDTICYPAKLMHGHLEWLIREQPDAIFYPDMSYNIDEKLGVDHYNCPVVAYYPQVLKMNMPSLSGIPFICDFISISDQKQFEKRIADILQRYFHKFSTREIRDASEAAFIEYDSYRKAVREKAAEYIAKAKENSLPVIVLCGRPYHLDPEINHGIDKLLCELGSVVITEDAISGSIAPFETGVRNQWTYHARMYSAAKYITEADKTEDMHLVQLVSFGCGVDAITTDEVRSILEKHGRDYTQIKIDEISNMGAVTIRMRSLLAMLEEKRRAKS